MTGPIPQCRHRHGRRHAPASRTANEEEVVIWRHAESLELSRQMICEARIDALIGKALPLDQNRPLPEGSEIRKPHIAPLRARPHIDQLRPRGRRKCAPSCLGIHIVDCVTAVLNAQATRSPSTKHDQEQIFRKPLQVVVTGPTNTISSSGVPAFAYIPRRSCYQDTTNHRPTLAGPTRFIVRRGLPRSEDRTIHGAPVPIKQCARHKCASRGRSLSVAAGRRRSLAATTNPYIISGILLPARARRHLRAADRASAEMAQMHCNAGPIGLADLPSWVESSRQIIDIFVKSPGGPLRARSRTPKAAVAPAQQ
jgi:hypothetical protein